MTGHLHLRRKFFLIACILLSLQAHAQTNFWEPARGPMIGVPLVLASDSQGNLFTITRFGHILQLAMYRSDDGGDTWSEIMADFPEICCISILIIDRNNDFWIGTDEGIYRSSDNGESWVGIGNGSPGQTEIDQMVFGDNGNIFVGTEFGVYRSTDNGETWTNKGLRFISAMAVHPNGDLYVGNIPGTQAQLWRSVNTADSWRSINTGLPEEFLRIKAIAIHPNGDIFVGTGSQGVFRSMDNGDSWHSFNIGLPDPTRVGALVVHENGDLLLGDGSGAGMYRYNQDGDAWLRISSGLGEEPRVWFIYTGDSGDIFVGLSGTGLFRSVDNGDTWRSTERGLTDTRVRSLVVQEDGDVFAGTDRAGVFRSSDRGGTWRQVNSGLSGRRVNDLAVHTDGDLFVNAGGIFRSSDDGANWRKLEAAGALGIGHDGTVFVGALRSFDKGETWQEVDGLDRARVASFGFHCNGDVFAATRKEVNLGQFEKRLSLLARYDNIWRKVNSIPSGDFFSMPFAFLDDGRILAGTRDGIFVSSDHGDNWQETGTAFALEADPVVTALLTNGNGEIYAATLLSVYRSMDNGENWTNLDSGLPNANMSTLSLDNNGTLYVGTLDGVYRSVDPVGVAEKTKVCTALTFRLEQNYPNPFNPKTAIRFHLAERSRVELSVFDLRGGEVATLAKREFQEGDHKITYEPLNLASGVYFYRLQVDVSSETSQRRFITTRRFTLLK